MIKDPDAAELAELFSAFSDASRLKIISALVEGEKNVSDIAQSAGLSESATSHHLRGLRQLKLVRGRKEGRQVFYSLLDDHVHELYRIGKEHILHG
ncbi:MAG TPA: metalloregulator ArsR/SmtB family transcription factor [Anaerolineales bacterium]|jgi:ArsR family transcriptional regulator|nr:metalloregulator ArsR/SmtB family transcription factor [Anaerolineales bacterium]